jgi:hypothetical protein
MQITKPNKLLGIVTELQMHPENLKNKTKEEENQEPYLAIDVCRCSAGELEIFAINWGSTQS